MSAKTRPLFIALFLLGACSPSRLPREVSAPVFTEETFAAEAAIKSKAELQTKIFDTAIDTLAIIAEAERGVLHYDGKGWGPVELPTDADLNAVWGNKDYLFIAGDDGVLFRSADGGLRWEALKSGVSLDLYKLYGGDNYLYIIGEQGLILRSNDNGETWEQQSSGTKASLRGVWGFSSREVYVVGDGGLILTTRSGGKTWTQQPSGVTTALLDIWGQSNKKLYAVGEGGTILESVDRGKTWEAQSSGVDFLLTSIRGLDASELYIAGIGGTILHQHEGGAWEIEAGFRLGGYSLNDTYWSRQEHPLFAAMFSSGDSIYAVGGDRLWALWPDHSRTQSALPLFPSEDERISTHATPQFQGVWASPSKGLLVVVGSQWHHRALRHLREAVSSGDLARIAKLLELVQAKHPERYELSVARSLALLLQNDSEAGYLAKKTLTTLPNPEKDELSRELAADLWFFIGEFYTLNKNSKSAQAAYLHSDWLLPSALAYQRIDQGPCLAEVKDRPIKATRFSGWSALYAALYGEAKEAALSEDAAKRSLCAKEPSGCTSDGPWLLKNSRRAFSGKEEVVLSLVFLDTGGKLFALPEVYHSPLDHTGIGEALFSTNLLILGDGLVWIAIEGATFERQGGPQSGYLQEERFFDLNKKQQVFSFSQTALVQTYGQGAEATHRFRLPVDGKVNGRTITLQGAGCDRRVKL